MNSRALMAGAGLGAGIIYLLDPDRGARRRARLRDTAVHAASVTTRAVGTTSRDARHRMHGTASSLRHLVRGERVDDQVLAERVRAKLGRLVSHPHAIDVAATDGSVTLSGPILEREAPRLLRAVHRVRGVCDLIDRLDRHEQAGNVPALQGGRVPAGDRPDVLQDNWAPTTRAIVCTAGTALAAPRTCPWRVSRDSDRVGARSMCRRRSRSMLPLARFTLSGRCTRIFRDSCRACWRYERAIVVPCNRIGRLRDLRALLWNSTPRSHARYRIR